MTEPIPIPGQIDGERVMQSEENAAAGDFAPFAEILQRINPAIRKKMMFDDEPFDPDALAKDPIKIEAYRSRGYFGISARVRDVNEPRFDKAFELFPEGREKNNINIVFLNKEGEPYKKTVLLALREDRTTRPRTESVGAPIFPADSQGVIDFAHEVFDIPEMSDVHWNASDEQNRIREDTLLLVADKTVGGKRFHAEASNIGIVVLTIEKAKLSPQKSPEVPKD